MKINIMKNIVSIAMVGYISLYANHPSFDCSKVRENSSEGIICASDTLMSLDKKLAEVYKKALLQAGKNDMLNAHQRGWIKGRNDCWKDTNEVKCIENQYTMQIEELTKKYLLSSVEKTQTKSYSFDKTLSLGGISFHVTTVGKGSLRQLSIVPAGLDEDNSVINQEIDGEVLGMEIDDLNHDGSPEIYIYITSSGSGGYGNVVAYSTNHNKSLSAIYLPDIDVTAKESKGYMGHDIFSLNSNRLVRRFPIYKENDSNAKPTGGTRQLQYELIAGEASWILKLVNTTEF
jgi:uncharacterized protein YecT (DUF1311 family)